MTRRAATEAALAWPTGIKAAKWATLTLARVGGYARSSAVPASIRGTGVAWSDLEDLALTIMARACAVEPPDASIMLRCVAAQGVDKYLRDEATRAILAGVRGRFRALDELPRRNREVVAHVAVLRVVHATFRPDAPRKPPRIWYAKAADVSRASMFRRRWLESTNALEAQAATLRDMGSAALETSLDALGVIDDARY